MSTAYCTLADVYAYGIPQNACGNVSVQAQQNALNARCDYADGKLNARYPQIVPPYPFDFIQAICQLTAWDIWMMRGANPSAGTDTQFETRGQMAMKYFDDVERQRMHPNFVTGTSPSPDFPAPMVISKPLQGWYPGSGQNGC